MEARQAHVTLAANTVAFTICFAAWMLNGVLVTFLVDNRVFDWSGSQMGILIGAPVLTGSLFRLPAGMLTDKFGGRPVFAATMVLAALPMFLLGRATGFHSYLLASLGFGLAGTTFAIGIAFSSVWYSKKWQGTVLGVFGVGNAGSAITTLAAPQLLRELTAGGTNLDAWRRLPAFYAGALLVTAVLFLLVTRNRKPQHAQSKTLKSLLAPLGCVRVWRLGLYYFLVFGGFVALAQWLVPYYVNVYAMSLVTAGLLTSIFALPSGVIRALGGWLSDRFGARRVMYGVLGITGVCCLLLFFPKMDIESPGSGVMAERGGTVTALTESSIEVDGRRYALTQRPENPLTAAADRGETFVLPVVHSWHVPDVRVGDTVRRKQVLARGVTHIYFQANVWIFTFLVFVVGIAMGIGKAAVYKYIPDYFPGDVGVVGGFVGVIGGLGGFVCPLVFGYLLDEIGLWTSTWMFLAAVTLACLVWLHVVVRKIESSEARDTADWRLADLEGRRLT